MVGRDGRLMFEPSESKRAMAFPTDYRMLGTRREQQRMAGNAVCPPVARDVRLGRRRVPGRRSMTRYERRRATRLLITATTLRTEVLP